MDVNTWEPYYSTELRRPAMIFCSSVEGGGHWVHAQCMELSEALLVRLSQGSSQYFCTDHGGLMLRQEMTPPPPPRRAALALKRTAAMKMQNKKKTPPSVRMTPAKKSFLRRLFN